MTRPDFLPQLEQLTGTEPEPVALAAWKLAVSNGRLHRVDALLDGDTLQLAAVPLAKTTAWGLLLRNAGLKPPSRLVLTLCNQVLLRSEAVLDGIADPARCLNSAVSSLREGLVTAKGGLGPALGRVEPWDVERTLAEAGLEGRFLADGRFRVDPAGAGSRPALIGPDPVARVDMLPPGDYPVTVRQAVAALLLRVTAGVRFVRAAGESSGAARLEVRFFAAPAPAELQTAVAALALASRCTEELAVLTREDAAAMFLKVTGIPETEGGDRTCQLLQPM